jgi:hypothetical protein
VTLLVTAPDLLIKLSTIKCVMEIKPHSLSRMFYVSPTASSICLGSGVLIIFITVDIGCHCTCFYILHMSYCGHSRHDPKLIANSICYVQVSQPYLLLWT